MNKRLLVFLLFIFLFISGCENVAEQMVLIPGMSEEIAILAGTVSEDSSRLTDLNEETADLLIASYIADNIEGKGTIDDPFLIYEVADLLVLQIGKSALDKHYKLMDDIYLPEVEGYATGNWTPVGSIDEPFTGTFDGNGKKISRLKIYFSEQKDDMYSIALGFFGCISGEFAFVKDLSLVDFEIFVENEIEFSVTAGGISGWLMQQAVVKNCTISGNLAVLSKNAKNVGGIVGYNNLGNIYDCTTYVHIKTSTDSTGSGIDYVGGIAGYNVGIISGCATEVSIEAPDKGYAGGIAGANYREIRSSYSVGNISGAKWAGGIAGTNYGTNFFSVNISNCFSAIDIKTFTEGGGIVGNNYNAAIKNCYSFGTIVAGENAGGIAGRIKGASKNEAFISNCFSVQKSITGKEGVGRIVGSYANGILDNNYAWAGVSADKNGASYTIFDNGNYIDGASIYIDTLTSERAYEKAGWDIYGDSSTWILNDSFLLPVLNGMESDLLHSYDVSYFNVSNELIVTPFEHLKGSGTKSDPYQIYTVDDLNKMREYPEYFSGSHYKLMNDVALEKVDYNQSNWEPIGTEKDPFKGAFDGNNKTISGIIIYDETDKTALGLFGCVDESSTIMNLHVTNIKVSYNPNVEAIIGGIAAYNAGLIENCSTSGKIAPATLIIPDLERASQDESFLKDYWGIIAETGGIVGINSGTIRESFSTVDITITASGTFGGIAATNLHIIEKCYFSGSISHLFLTDPIHAFMAYAGGIAGLNYYAVSDCYSTGYIEVQGIAGGIIGYNYFPDIQPSESGIREYHIISAGDGSFQIVVTGGVDDKYKKSTVVSNCYSLNESLQGSYACGGIVGYNSGIIDSCVALPQSLRSFANLGLIVGYSEDYNDVINNYTSNEFNFDLSDSDTSTKRITTSRLNQKSFYQSLGWDFSDVWEMKTGYGFPVLKEVRGQ